MPGAPYYMPAGTISEGGQAAGYAEPASGSHWGFIFWTVVYVAIAVAILGGLQVGGFSFVFRHR